MDTPRHEGRVAEAEYLQRAVVSETKDQEKNRRPWPWFLAAVVLFVIDRVLKDMALGGIYRRLGPFIEFTLFKNRGIAFSLPLDDRIFWILAVPVFLFLVAMLFFSMRKGRYFSAVALIFIILGAASNLDDRRLYQATIDYLLFFSRSAVNIADGMILGGVIALLFKPKKAER